MGYVDRFYYGRCRLIVSTNAASVTAKKGEQELTAETVEGKAEILVPNRNNYLITAGDKETTVFCGYGQCKRIEL